MPGVTIRQIRFGYVPLILGLISHRILSGRLYPDRRRQFQNFVVCCKLSRLLKVEWLFAYLAAGHRATTCLPKNLVPSQTLVQTDMVPLYLFYLGTRHGPVSARSVLGLETFFGVLGKLVRVPTTNQCMFVMLLLHFKDTWTDGQPVSTARQPILGP